MTSGAEKSASLRSMFARRTAALQRFAEWEARHISVAPPAAVLAAATGLYDLLPASSRTRAVQTDGVERMHRALSQLSMR